LAHRCWASEVGCEKCEFGLYRARILRVAMLSKYLALTAGLAIVVGWGPSSQAEVAARLETDGSAMVAASSEISEGTLVVAAREVIDANSPPGEQVKAGQGPAALRLAALSYEPAGLYAASEIPTILSDSDVIRYRKIFELQQLGMWNEADEHIGELVDDILLGHVMFQRYMHPTAYRSKFMELAAWLEDYADHPGSQRIYRLAIKRRPESAPAPVQPDRKYLGGVGEGTPAGMPLLPRRQLNSDQRAAVSGLEKKIAGLISSGMPTKATKVLRETDIHSWLTDAEFDRLSTNISRGFYSYGKDSMALSIADKAAQRSRHYVPGAYWIAGLAAWRLGEVSYAVQAFQNVAANGSGSKSLRAAGAFWAARAHAASGNQSLAESYFIHAASFPYTLYGLLALRALGDVPPFHWEPINLYSYDVERLLDTESVRRAIALKEVGKNGLAEQELRVYFPQVPDAFRTVLLRLSVALDLPALQIRIAGVLATDNRTTYESALYPIPEWKTDREQFIDQPLLLAIIRQESIFDERARSRRGARGLMQLMPRTATFVDGKFRYHTNSVHADKLYDPQLNLRLGQSYLHHLLSVGQFDGDLLLSLAAYNTGPTKVKKWINTVDYRSDPILFLESVPSPETRRFLRRVLTNLAIYSDRFNREWGTFDSLAAGEWPKYVDGRKEAELRKVARD
jgi:soluble lytic murein transglycosylase